MAETYATVQVSLRRFQAFEGQNKLQMQRLITGKDPKTGEQVDVRRELITPAQLFEQRLRGEEGDKAYLRANYVDTRLCVVPNPDVDEIKLVHGHPLIYSLNDKTKLVQGAMPVSQDQYQTTNGLVLTPSEVTEFRNNRYALPKKRKEIFEFAADGNTELATEYREDVCKSLGFDFNNVMGIYLPTTKGLRLLCVGAVDGVRSSAIGGYYLGYDGNGRLVGVAPEAPNSINVREAPRENGAPDLEAVMNKLSATGLQGRMLELARQELAPLYRR